ncbi:hypothetical protein SMSP2_01551 [Limihaloglobus sulfuriphilus]|uniref:Uncharacterized protein n=1 Tax=Limihaloglobus sulfuriphilus TaxID=1851148 RepID=A0A1Q2MEQ6_9BACT|nr:hypothetical protein [Limihaloglobus sulfuriphilus]AQQ71185.1 hypothetical protein SMSP2_01551 [Limihaloglobus sulfuriphilus]
MKNPSEKTVNTVVTTVFDCRDDDEPMFYGMFKSIEQLVKMFDGDALVAILPVDDNDYEACYYDNSTNGSKYQMLEQDDKYVIPVVDDDDVIFDVYEIDCPFTNEEEWFAVFVARKYELDFMLFGFGVTSCVL